MLHRFYIFFILIFMLAPLGAEEGPWDITQLLGMTPSQAIEVMGSPAEIYPVNVTENIWQSVLFYPKNLYLYLHQNRVWQVRLDNRYVDTFQGLTLGITREEAKTILGTPLLEEEFSQIYPMVYKSFPRRLRLIFTKDKLSDIFYYRSDF